MADEHSWPSVDAVLRDINPGASCARVPGVQESEGLVPATQLRLLLKPGAPRISQVVK